MGRGVEDLTEEIIDEFRNTLEYFVDRHPSNPLPPNTPIYLTGGHSQVGPAFAQTLSNGLGRELLFPTPPLEYSDNFPVPQFMVNVGLALKLL